MDFRVRKTINANLDVFWDWPKYKGFVYGVDEIGAIQLRQLNSRHRKTLNYETPAERFSQSVASTG
ncbi:hypothetical protein D3C86_1059570 [compost metagenome]